MKRLYFAAVFITVILLLLAVWARGASAQGSDFLVLAFTGDTVDFPSGCVPCDGSGGTPDLRGRFLMAASSTYAAGTSGGVASIDWSHEHDVDDHDHSGTTGSDGAHTHQMAAHSHTMSGAGGHTPTMQSAGSHNHTLVDYVLLGGKTNVSGAGCGRRSDHSWLGYYQNGGSQYWYSVQNYTNYQGSHTHTMNAVSNHTHGLVATTSGMYSAGDHSHSVATETDLDTGLSGNSSESVLNPYYSLNYACCSVDTVVGGGAGGLSLSEVQAMFEFTDQQTYALMGSLLLYGILSLLSLLFAKSQKSIWTWRHALGLLVAVIVIVFDRDGSAVWVFWGVWVSISLVFLSLGDWLSGLLKF